MSRELPADVEKALDAIAGGWTREPTVAHPDCNCLAESKRRNDLTVNGLVFGFTRVPCPVHPKARR